MEAICITGSVYSICWNKAETDQINSEQLARGIKVMGTYVCVCVRACMHACFSTTRKISVMCEGFASNGMKIKIAARNGNEEDVENEYSQE